MTDSADAPEDVALVLGATEDGETIAALRKRGEQVTPTLLRKAAEGAPIQGELVQLTPREEPALFDVETLYAPPAPRPTSDGPAQVASERYRSGWGRVFGGKRRKALPS